MLDLFGVVQTQLSVFSCKEDMIFSSSKIACAKPVGSGPRCLSEPTRTMSAINDQLDNCSSYAASTRITVSSSVIAQSSTLVGSIKQHDNSKIFNFASHHNMNYTTTHDCVQLPAFNKTASQRRNDRQTDSRRQLNVLPRNQPYEATTVAREIARITWRHGMKGCSKA